MPEFDEPMEMLTRRDSRTTEVERLRAEVQHLQKQVAEYQRRASEQSWITNPDRSGGYTPPEEVERLRNGGW